MKFLLIRLPQIMRLESEANNLCEDLKKVYERLSLATWLSLRSVQNSASEMKEVEDGEEEYL